MKRKSRRCSTGHGTGVTPPVELSDLRDKGRHSRLFAGRPFGIAQGGVERPERPIRPRGPAKLERQGYFRKRRLARLALEKENLDNLGTWPFNP